MLAFALILTYPLKLLSVQSNSERRVVLEGSTGTAHYGGANVPNVQTKCPTGCYRLHSAGYDNNHAPAITSAKVSLVHYQVHQVSGVSTMKQQQIYHLPPRYTSSCVWFTCWELVIFLFDVLPLTSLQLL